MSDPPASNFAYRAFLSYSHRDEAWADWLHKALEAYRVPRRLVGTTTAHGEIPGRLNPIFRDREELASTAALGATINAALVRSENLIVICSPAAAASRWVNEEVLAWRRMGRGERIYCMIVAGEPNATDLCGRAAEECFCPALRFAMDVAGGLRVEHAEPVAADARPGKDGKGNAKLKLIAGMLDVGFDDLKQREQHRRLRRMAAITAVAVCVMAVTVVLAVFALISRHQAITAEHTAEMERRQAVIDKQAAERRQKQAEGLVDFMLGNLSDKLDAESQLDIMQDVDNKAMKYFAALPPTDVNDTALAQRAKALEKIGTVRTDVGNLPGALQAYHASARIFSQLALAEPRNVARQVAYSRALAFIGMIHWNQGKLAAAQQTFASARRALQGSLAQASGDAALTAQMTYLDDDLDHVLAAQGHPAAAFDLARERLRLDEQLVKAKPTDADYVSGLGDAYSELGRLSLQRGDLAAAVAEDRADDAIERRLATAHPKDNRQLQRLLQAHAVLGRALAMTGDAAGGARDLQQAVAWATQLARFDPQAADARDLAALYSIQLARLRRVGGDLRAAHALDAHALLLLTALIHGDPSNHYWQGDLGSALIEQAAEARAAGNRTLAQADARHALRILEPMLARDPNERDALLATVTAKLLLASATRDPRAAGVARAQALRSIQDVATDRDDPRLLAVQVQALLSLGSKAPARPLVARLRQEGYRDPGFVALLQRAHIAYPANPDVQPGIVEGVAADPDPPAAPPPSSGGRR